MPFRFGTAYLHDEIPRVWSRNYLSLERDLESATAGLVSAEAESRITTCSDLDQLITWFRRAATATSIHDVFDQLEGLEGS